jgi:hypothetical protein
MMPGKLRAPIATPKTLPSQYRRSRIGGGTPASGGSGPQRRPQRYRIIARCASGDGASPGGPTIIPRIPPRPIMPIIGAGGPGGAGHA